MKAIRWDDAQLAAYNAKRGGKAPKTTEAPAIRAVKPRKAVKNEPRGDFSEKAAPLTLELPWPPTGNHATKHTKAGRHYLTNEAKRYRGDVLAVAYRVRGGRAAPIYCCRLRVAVEFCPPDKRKRDLDNAWKTLSDALQWAGIYQDDCLIDDLRLIRVSGVPGAVKVLIEEIA